MKILHLLIVVLLFISCTVGIREEVIQKEDKSFLHFKGKIENIKVIIDDGDPIILEESSDGEDFSEKLLYQVTPGKHEIKAYKNNELIVDRVIFVGNNETKEIEIQ